MNISCGVDIIEVDRIRRNIEKSGERFLNKVFTDNEIEYCNSKKLQKYQHFAGRFAAKEAAFKAISRSLDNKYSLSWKDIEIVNDSQGRPELKLSNIDTSRIENMDISISHCELYAISNVSILCKK
ncbi:MAG: holo-ACP synthase [Clostridia bacterium]|nr:holo-ACP synthase [Clostridia bacterium]